MGDDTVALVSVIVLWITVFLKLGIFILFSLKTPKGGYWVIMDESRYRKYYGGRRFR